MELHILIVCFYMTLKILMVIANLKTTYLLFITKRLEYLKEELNNMTQLRQYPLKKMKLEDLWLLLISN